MKNEIPIKIVKMNLKAHSIYREKNGNLTLIIKLITNVITNAYRFLLFHLYVNSKAQS